MQENAPAQLQYKPCYYICGNQINDQPCTQQKQNLPCKPFEKLFLHTLNMLELPYICHITWQNRWQDQTSPSTSDKAVRH